MSFATFSVIIFDGEILLGRPECTDCFVNDSIHDAHEDAVIYIDEEYHPSLVVESGVYIAWFESCFLESFVMVLVPYASCCLVAIDVAQ